TRWNSLLASLYSPRRYSSRAPASSVAVLPVAAVVSGSSVSPRRTRLSAGPGGAAGTKIFQRSQVQPAAEQRTNDNRPSAAACAGPPPPFVRRRSPQGLLTAINSPDKATDVAGGPKDSSHSGRAAGEPPPALPGANPGATRPPTRASRAS